MGTNMAKFDFLNLPLELQENVLQYLDLQTLLNCRLTCKSVYEILTSNRVWRVILTKNIGLKKLTQCGITSNIHLEWQWSYLLAKHRLLGENLLNKTDSLKSWRILSSGGDGWTIETPPMGADDLPEEVGLKSCFATSYHSCSKEQVIDLWKKGFAAEFLDQLQPKIIIGEWYTGRFDCGSVYELKIELITKENEIMKVFGQRETIEQWQGSAWNKIYKEIENYGPGLRYIRFFHGGMDLQFWKGHYGSKMAGAFLKISL